MHKSLCATRITHHFAERGTHVVWLKWHFKFNSNLHKCNSISHTLIVNNGKWTMDNGHGKWTHVSVVQLVAIGEKDHWTLVPIEWTMNIKDPTTASIQNRTLSSYQYCHTSTINEGLTKTRTNGLEVFTNWRNQSMGNVVWCIHSHNSTSSCSVVTTIVVHLCRYAFATAVAAACVHKLLKLNSFISLLK